MRYVKNSRGYTMLLALVAVVLFSILGITLMSLTSSGIVKNETRLSTVQAKDLAEKGIDFAVNSVQNKLVNSLKDANGNFALTKGEFERLLLETLNNPSLACPQELFDIKTADFGIKIDGDIENTKTLVCIDKIEELPVDIDNPEKNKYKRYVTFKSYGISNGKHEVTSAKIAIGTDAIPDQLKYAVSSNDGEVFIYGGIEVTGDIKSDNNIHIFEKAFSNWSYNPDWHNSVSLKLNPTIGNSSGKLIFSNPESKLFFYNQNTNTKLYNEYKLPDEKKGKIKLKNPSEILNINNQNELKSILTHSPKVNMISKVIPKDSINIRNEILQMYKNKNNIIAKKGNNFDGVNKNNPSSNEVKLNQDKNSKTLIYQEKCVQSNHYNNCQKYDLSEEKANLIIGDERYKRDIDIQGTYYINGDLKIQQTNLKSNAILYVNGDVEIRFSSLSELVEDKSLIIFATGEIFIANISENSSHPSTIKGFFYSQSDMTMYGVGSNIKVIGGLSAKNIFLTGVRGNMNMAANKQLEQPSRLQIIYDENIIHQFTEFKRDKEEELVTQINEPETLERN